MKFYQMCSVVMCFFAFQAVADIYSWTDKNGVKHFSNDPPPKDEEITDLIVMKESKEETSSQKTTKQSQEETSKEAASTNKKVEMYVDPSSEYCIQAMAFFDLNKIPYTKHDLTASDEEAKRFEALNGKGVPLIFIDDQRMDGWNEEQARQLLGMKK
jgi:glutaredoxin